MKIIDSLRNIAAGLYRSLKRFPITILFSAAVAVTLIVISELEPINDINLRDNLRRMAMIFALGVPLSLCIKLFFERKDEEKKYKLIAYYAVGAVLLVLYYFFLLDKLNLVSTTRYAAVSLALYLGFLYISYLPKKEQYEMYIIKILTGFFITVIYSVVLYAGLAAILFTVDKLLDIRVLGKVYYYTWLSVACVFAPSYFLADIPTKFQQYTEENYPKLLRILTLYIVMPLLTVYTTILYIYFVKIIVTRQWPVGLVSHLVLWYSVITAIVLFFITPIKDKNRWAENFLSFAPKIILPILVMMFISMGIRINAYGITENRYYVVILGLWVSSIMLYFSFIKRYRNIILPVTLSIVALISVFGPWSSYSISKMSQNSRFEKILSGNSMLSGSSIKPAPSTMSKEDKTEISRILDYFRSSHSLKDVKYLPMDFKMEDMEKVLGFPYENTPYQSPEGDFYYMLDPNDNAIDIKGYDYMIDTRGLYNKNASAQNVVSASYDPETSNVKINYNSSIIYEKDLRFFVKGLADKHIVITPTKENSIPLNEMTFTDENEKVKVKIIFMHLSGRKDESKGNIQVNGAEFYILVKIK